MLLFWIEGPAFQDERKSGLIGSEFYRYNEDDDNDDVWLLAHTCYSSLGQFLRSPKGVKQLHM